MIRHTHVQSEAASQWHFKHNIDTPVRIKVFVDASNPYGDKGKYLVEVIPLLISDKNGQVSIFFMSDFKGEVLVCDPIQEHLIKEELYE